MTYILLLIQIYLGTVTRVALSTRRRPGPNHAVGCKRLAEMVPGAVQGGSVARPELLVADEGMWTVEKGRTMCWVCCRAGHMGEDHLGLDHRNPCPS